MYELCFENRYTSLEGCLEVRISTCRVIREL